MAGRGRPKTRLVLAPAERATLEQWTRGSTKSPALALRARIVLGCAGGGSNTEVARRLEITLQTVGKWRARFVVRRLDGLRDEPRPGTPRRLSDATIEQVVATTMESKPSDAVQWSVRSMAATAGISPTSVHRIWRAFALQPRRSEAFELSIDPQFIEKVRDVVGLYLSPPAKVLVLCVDERTGIEASERTQPSFPTQPRQVESRAHEYVPHGTTTLFAALDAATSTAAGERPQRRRSIELRKFLDTIEDHVPAHLDMHLILDDHDTHETARMRRFLAARPRFHLHFPPADASWISLVERWCATLAPKQLRRDAHCSTRQLEQAIRDHLRIADANQRPFLWTKPADEIGGSSVVFFRCTSGTDY